MNKAELYADIPYQILERNNLPLSYIELSLDQKEFVDYFLGDNVGASTKYELKDLAGEK